MSTLTRPEKVRLGRSRGCTRHRWKHQSLLRSLDCLVEPPGWSAASLSETEQPGSACTQSTPVSPYSGNGAKLMGHRERATLPTGASSRLRQQTLPWVLHTKTSKYSSTGRKTAAVYQVAGITLPNRAHITYLEIQLLHTDSEQMLNIRTKEFLFSWRA